MQTIDYSRELPPGQLALHKIAPADYPDFSLMQSDLDSLDKAIGNSLAYLARPGSQPFYPYLDIDHDRAVATLIALRDIVARARTAAPLDWNAEIRSRFEVYQSLGAPNADNTAYSGQVLFTGYFTPIYEASLTRQGPYQYPLYKRPADLAPPAASAPAGAPPTPASPASPASPPSPAASQRYLTRAQIEANPSPLAGSELVWVKSRWEAYVITVQGSARLHLTNGQTFEIGYAGSNGYDYTSPGRQMLADGVITRAQLTLHGLQAYFAAHPQDMDKYLPLNQRYIFFAQTQGGPFGSLNVPVTPLASIATDKDVYPRALPAFLDVPIPTAGGTVVPFHGFMLDQDTGGGIRAAGRCDIYMGVGPAAEQRAGRQLHPGTLYYLAVKPELVRQYAPAPNQPLTQPSTPAPQPPSRVPAE
jgi:membrane-bound lytic murein transglycosylase A